MSNTISPPESRSGDAAPLLPAASPLAEPFALGVKPDRVRLYYGWVMLPLSMAALIVSSPGQTFGVSVFMEAVRVELSLTHSQLALAYTLGTVLGAIPIAWIGWQMDRRGIRPTMLAVLAVFAAACFGFGLVRNWWQMLAAFTVLRMLGPGALSLLSSNVLAFWFHRRLGVVEGLRRASMAAAMALIPAAHLILLESVGWRGAYMVLGSLIGLVAAPVFWKWFRSGPAEVGQMLDGAVPSHPASVPVAGDLPPQVSFAAALKSSAFWNVLLGSSLFGLIHTGVFFSISAIFSDRGLSEQDAAWMLTFFAVSLGLMQLAGGWLADRMAPAWQLSLAMVLFALGLSGLWMAEQAGSMWLSGWVLGASQGLYFASAQPMWPRYFGPLHLGKLRGVLLAVNVATSSLGPLVVGLTRDTTGSFDDALFWFAVAPLPLAAASLWIRRPRENDELEPATP